jgi:subtilisin family serine protease
VWVAATVGACVASLSAATAAPAVAQNAPEAHFVVVGPPHGSLAPTEASIRAAGGEVVRAWPQIGVVVATSTSADFAAVVRDRPGVVAAGASRNLVELRQMGARAADAAARKESLTPVEAVRLPEVASGPAEPLEPHLWGLRQIRADQAAAISGGSPDVVVGVLDTGVDPTHPDLAPNFDASKSVGCAGDGVPDTSPEAWLPAGWAHGTHVAGTIAAARNGIGVAGVAPNVKIASVKLIHEDGLAYPENAICALVWAADHGIDITNNSYSIDPWFLWCRTDPDQAAGIQAVQRAVDYSVRKGVVNVVAMGNNNWNLSHPFVDTLSPNNGGPTQTRVVGNECVDVPNQLPGVVSVTSVGFERRKAFYSRYGILETDVTAPGGDQMQPSDSPDGSGLILSTIPGGWAYLQGTSMATPHVAGVVALIRSKHPDWSVSQVTAALGRHADRIPCPPGGTYDPDGTGTWFATCEGGRSGRGFYGAGLVDALDAVTR